MKKLSMLLAIVLIASWSVVRAQQPQESSVPPSVSSQTSDINRKYILEIYVLPKIGPTYLLVGGPKYKPGSAFFPRFIRIAAEPQGRLPITSIKLEPQFDGKVADVKVTLIRGEGAELEEQLLHVYQLAPGEQKTLTHMRDFGIEPFHIKLLDAAPPLPPEPSIQNFTKSIEIVKVRRENKPMSAYGITLRNLSEKSVSALKVDLTSDGQEGPAALPDGDEGRPLIEPGGETDLWIPVTVSVRNGTDYVPGTAASHTINIRSVVFTDLSFEGDQEQACSYHAKAIGERLWLKGIISFFDKEIANTASNDQLEAAKQFRVRVSALRFTLDETERNENSPVSPTCPKPANYATSTARQLNMLLLREVDQFIAEKPVPLVTFKSWLEEKRKRYTGWLARVWCPC